MSKIFLVKVRTVRLPKQPVYYVGKQKQRGVAVHYLINLVFVKCNVYIRYYESVLILKCG